MLSHHMSRLRGLLLKLQIRGVSYLWKYQGVCWVCKYNVTIWGVEGKCGIPQYEICKTLNLFALWSTSWILSNLEHLQMWTFYTTKVKFQTYSDVKDGYLKQLLEKVPSTHWTSLSTSLFKVVRVNTSNWLWQTCEKNVSKMERGWRTYTNPILYMMRGFGKHLKNWSQHSSLRS